MFGSKDLGLHVQISNLFMLANQEQKTCLEQVLDIAQGDSSQVLRTFKLQEKKKFEIQ